MPALSGPPSVVAPMAASKQYQLKTYLRRIRAIVICLGALYLMAIALVMVPTVQTYAIYAHHIHFHGFNRFDIPEHYGLAPGKAVNLKLAGADNNTLGAWFIFSDKIYRKLPYPPPDNTDFSHPRRKLIPSALRKAPTILYLHGNTGTRAHYLRTSFYTTLTARLGANVMSVDYRGYGDSEGNPTVRGVSRDARSAWDYLISQGANPSDIILLGHSLGTAIAAILSAELSREGVRPRGTVLMAPFSSVRMLIDHYYLLGFIPLLKPLSVVPFAPQLVTRSLVHRFDTLSLIPEIKSDVLIAHADDDWTIPSFHSTLLFEKFIEPHLPSRSLLSEDALSQNAWGNHTHFETIRELKRAEVVSTTVLDDYAFYEETRPEVAAREDRKVALLRTKFGGHNIGRVEAIQEAIGRMFTLF